MLNQSSFYLLQTTPPACMLDLDAGNMGHFQQRRLCWNSSAFSRPVASTAKHVPHTSPLLSCLPLNFPRNDWGWGVSLHNEHHHFLPSSPTQGLCLEMHFHLLLFP